MGDCVVGWRFPVPAGTGLRRTNALRLLADRKVRREQVLSSAHMLNDIITLFAEMVYPEKSKTF